MRLLYGAGSSKLVLRNNLEAWDGVGGEKEVQEGKDICIPMADSCLGLTENSKILQSNYPSIKNKLIKNKKICFKNQ